MNDEKQTNEAGPQAGADQATRPIEFLEDQRKRVRDAFEAFAAQVETFWKTLGHVPRQAPPGVDRAEHAHAVQLADEAIKGIADAGETFVRATSRLLPFAS